MSNLDPASIANLKSLTMTERANLAAFLIDSLETDPDVDAEVAWEKEIACRIADLQSGKSKTVS